MPTVFTPAQRQAYDRDGFVLIPSLFDAEEIALMRQAMEQDPALNKAFTSVATLRARPPELPCGTSRGTVSMV